MCACVCVCETINWRSFDISNNIDINMERAYAHSSVRACECVFIIICMYNCICRSMHMPVSMSTYIIIYICYMHNYGKYVASTETI